MKRGKKWIGAGVAVVIVAIAVVVLAQGSGSGGDALNAIAKAAEVTQREPGGRATLKVKTTSSSSPEGIAMSGTMEFEDNGRTEGTMVARGLSTGKEVEVESIADGTTSYTTSDEIDSLPGGKKWVKLDLSGAAKLQGGATPADEGPQEGLKVLEQAQEVEEVGTEDIDGVPATHYRCTFPVTEELFGVKVHYSAPRADVWIDSKDRVRRMRVVVTGSVNETEGSTTTAIEMDYLEFGRVPKIELPPPDEVFDATSEFESGVQEAAKGN